MGKNKNFNCPKCGLGFDLIESFKLPNDKQKIHDIIDEMTSENNYTNITRSLLASINCIENGYSPSLAWEIILEALEHVPISKMNENEKK